MEYQQSSEHMQQRFEQQLPMPQISEAPFSSADIAEEETAADVTASEMVGPGRLAVGPP